jgi:hypothetical protein
MSDSASPAPIGAPIGANRPLKDVFNKKYVDAVEYANSLNAEPNNNTNIEANSAEEAADGDLDTIFLDIKNEIENEIENKRNPFLNIINNFIINNFKKKINSLKIKYNFGKMPNRLKGLCQLQLNDDDNNSFVALSNFLYSLETEDFEKIKEQVKINTLDLISKIKRNTEIAKNNNNYNVIVYILTEKLYYSTSKMKGGKSRRRRRKTNKKKTRKVKKKATKKKRKGNKKRKTRARTRRKH